VTKYCIVTINQPEWASELLLIWKHYFVLYLLLNINYSYWTNTIFTSHGLWTGVFPIYCSTISYSWITKPVLSHSLQVKDNNPFHESGDKRHTQTDALKKSPAVKTIVFDSLKFVNEC